MENQFPSFGKFKAMNIQPAKALSILLLIVITATASDAFHLPDHHFNSTDGNGTDSDDSPHRHGNDSHRGNSAHGHQYGRLSSNVYERAHDAQKEDYKNYTVHVVPPLANRRRVHDNTGNLKVISRQTEAIINDTNQEEVNELSQHGVVMERKTFAQNQKTENKQDNTPAIAIYKNDIQEKEPDTLTKLLSLEQRIAAYLIQHKNQYLHNSPKDKKIDQKKEVIVNEPTANRGLPDKRDDNTKESLRDKSMHTAYSGPPTYGNKFEEDGKEIANIKVVPKYNLYDDVGKAYIGVDHTVKNDIGIEKDYIIKDVIRKENIDNNNKNGTSTKNGKQGNVKDDNKAYDYYYDTERHQVSGSTRSHYDYDDKGFVTDDTIDNKEDKHKSKDVLKDRQGGKLLHEAEIFHDTGSFHTVENFIEENSPLKKQEPARWKPKPGSKNIGEDDEKVAMSAFKARVTRGEDEDDDKRLDDLKHPLIVDQNVGVNNSGDSSKDEDYTKEEYSGDNEKGKIVQEKNKQLPIGNLLDPIDQEVKNEDSESLLQKDGLFHTQSNTDKSATLGLTSVHSEPTLQENTNNETDKNERRYPDSEDMVKTLAKSEIIKEPSMSTDHKALSGMDSIEEVDILFKYSTNSDHPITTDAKHTGSKNITEEKLLPQSGDTNKLDSGDLKTAVARSEAYLAVWASAASKNNTDTNVSSNFEARSPTRLERVKDNKEAYAGDNKTMLSVSQGVNKIAQDNNKTGDSRVMGNFNDSHLRKQNEGVMKDLKINTALSNEETQNNSKISQVNINQSNNSNNDTNIKDNTLGNIQNQVMAGNSTSSSNSSLNNKMKVNVNKLTVSTEAVSSKLVVSEIVERASSSRKAVSQINGYQKVPDQVDPFYVSAAAMSSSDNRPSGTKDIEPAINTTSNRAKASATSKLDKSNQPTTQIQNPNQEISSQINISVDTNGTNNSYMPNKVVSMNTNSSKEVTTFRDSRKNTTLYGDNLDSTSDNFHKFRENDFLKNNASAKQFLNDQAKPQPNSSTELQKVFETDNKPQNNPNVTINTTDTQTNEFNVESLLAPSNQSETRSTKHEPERRTVAPKTISSNVFSTTKTQISSKSATATTSNTFKNNDGRKDALQISGKPEVTTKIADKTKEVNSSVQVSQKITVINNLNYESHTTNVKEPKNDTFFNDPSSANLTPLDDDDKNRTDRQQSDPINKVSYFTNGSIFHAKTQMSNRSMGLNVPRKLLSFAEIETYENSSNKIISAAHNVESNLSITAKSTNISGVGISKLNLTSGKIDTVTVKTGKGPSSTENNWKNGSHSFNGSSIKPAGKVTNLSYVHNGRLHGNATMVFLKLEAHEEPTRTEQNVSINPKIKNTNLTQNISNVHKNRERDPVVTVTFTVKKNSSNLRNEKLTENATSNSFQKKTDLQPEVMANERHHQQKSQNQKLEPEILSKGDPADTVDLKVDANSNKDDINGGIIDKEDSDKTKSRSFSNNSQNTGVNNKVSDGNGDDQDTSDQLPTNDQGNDTKNENNDSKLQNKNDGSSNPDYNSDVVKKDEQESGVGESDKITNSDVIKAQLDETSTKLDQEMSKAFNRKNSDLRSDNKLIRNDAKQLHDIDNVSASQKTTNMGKDVLQDGGSATRNDTKSPEADVESGSFQNDADTSNDDVNDEVPKNEDAGNSNVLPGSASTGSSSKIPEISPYKAQDFSLLKPGTAKAAASKDKNNIDQQKAKPLPAAATTNILKNSTTEGGGNASSSARSECPDDACSHGSGGAGAPQRAQAAVSAVLTTHFGPTKDQMIPFDLELLDLADNYDNTTGMFICTIPGTYVISLYLMSHPGAKVNARVLINNRPIAALWADDAKNAGFYPSSSTQTIAQLAFGDQVYVMLVDGGYGDSWVHANYNVFTIFLLYEQMF